MVAAWAAAVVTTGANLALPQALSDDFPIRAPLKGALFIYIVNKMDKTHSYQP